MPFRGLILTWVKHWARFCPLTLGRHRLRCPHGPPTCNSFLIGDKMHIWSEYKKHQKVNCYMEKFDTSAEFAVLVVLALWRSDNIFLITLNMFRHWFAEWYFARNKNRKEKISSCNYVFSSKKILKFVWNLQQSQLFPGTLNLAPLWFAKKDLVFNIHKICSSNSNNWISILTQYTDANVLKFSCHWMIEWKLNFNPPMSLNPYWWIYHTWKKRKY